MWFHWVIHLLTYAKQWRCNEWITKYQDFQTCLQVILVKFLRITLFQSQGNVSKSSVYFFYMMVKCQVFNFWMRQHESCGIVHDVCSTIASFGTRASKEIHRTFRKYLFIFQHDVQKSRNLRALSQSNPLNPLLKKTVTISSLMNLKVFSTIWQEQNNLKSRGLFWWYIAQSSIL